MIALSILIAGLWIATVFNTMSLGKQRKRIRELEDIVESNARDGRIRAARQQFWDGA